MTDPAAPAPDTAADPTAGAPPPAVGRSLRALDAALLATAVAAAAATAAGAHSGALAALALTGWLAIELGPAGRWLRAVRRLEWRRARALAVTGHALARHRRGRPDALRRAGDAYEREGRARSALAALGATPARTVGWLRGAGAAIGRLG